MMAGEVLKKNERQFVLKEIENDTLYKGVIDRKVLEDKSVDLIIEKVYEATLEEETSIEEATQTEIKKYTLVGLELRTT